LGEVVGDNNSYTLPNGDELIPDAAFISAERIPRPRPKRLMLAPDLAVEVFSPSNREREMQERVQSFLAAGTRIVWVVYPVTRVVDVYRSNADGSLTLRTVPFEGALDGEDVLPGFSLPVKDIFPAE
jgi:Uma2 family endonuclease